MTWNDGLSLKYMGENVWVWETNTALTKFEYKIVVKGTDGQLRWEKGGNRTFTPQKFECINPGLI